MTPSQTLQAIELIKKHGLLWPVFFTERRYFGEIHKEVYDPAEGHELKGKVWISESEQLPMRVYRIPGKPILDNPPPHTDDFNC